ncbi:uncharacterized protein LOC114753149 [Neltuma alba]|uniref:uncharacterized protein LOC114753149 n=1 Tax=Neltuma alba TaxID=207710 RepID=UPI0010A42504|nr:uncharacterized protein LOC114753149 [Prosopis alba]
MAVYTFPDVFFWIQNLPPVSEWSPASGSMTLRLCSSSTSQPSLNLSIARSLRSSKLFFAIVADFKIPVTLWTSKPFKPSSNDNTKSIKLLNESTTSNVLVNFIEAILHYGSNKNSPSLKFPKLDSILPNLPDTFNLAFLTLLFLVIIYEAPEDLRIGCVTSIKNHLSGSDSREASKLLMKLLGSNLEELWMRSVNLAITTCVVELRTVNQSNCRTPCALFSCAFSDFGLWKVQLYCPVIAMDVENSNNHSVDERLQFSLRYHQLEGVLQFNYQVTVQEKWVEIVVSIDNIRCDVVKLVNENLLRGRGIGAGEKHFPSRICLELTPTLQNQVLSLSVSKSTENPRREIGIDKSIEASLEPNNPLGLKVSAGETSTVSLKPWKFEESTYGYSANLNWFLHDSINGKEVFSSKPSKCALLNPRSWFRDRYSSAHRPFTRQGGIIFAGDEYGDSVLWKVDKGAIGKTMEWEIRGWIWLTYWPNKHKTFYSETRRFEFRETLHLHIA